MLRHLYESGVIQPSQLFLSTPGAIETGRLLRVQQHGRSSSRIYVIERRFFGADVSMGGSRSGAGGLGGVCLSCECDLRCFPIEGVDFTILGARQDK